MGAIRLSGLTKDYGDVVANEDVSFEVEEGEVFGYLGPNGAGKTTTIRTLMGFQSATDGTATVLGADIHDETALVDAKRRIGYLPANPQFDEQVTGEAVLDLHASIKGDSRREELLALFDVPVERKIRGYSTGQEQKLGLVQAFMHDPELVIMDEPTSGLDPLMQQRFNEFLRDEKRDGTTVFLSSHVLSEVRRVCDRIAIIRDGTIVTVEGVEELMHRSGKFVRMRVGTDLTADAIDLDGVTDLTIQSVDGTRAATTVATTSGSGESESSDGDSGRDAVTEVTFTYTGDFDALIEFANGYHVLELDVEEAPLERVFMQFYGDGNAPVDAVDSDELNSSRGDA